MLHINCLPLSYMLFCTKETKSKTSFGNSNACYALSDLILFSKVTIQRQSSAGNRIISMIFGDTNLHDDVFNLRLSASRALSPNHLTLKQFRLADSLNTLKELWITTVHRIINHFPDLAISLSVIIEMSKLFARCDIFDLNIRSVHDYGNTWLQVQ